MPTFVPDGSLTARRRFPLVLGTDARVAWSPWDHFRRFQKSAMPCSIQFYESEAVFTPSISVDAEKVAPYDVA